MTPPARSYLSDRVIHHPPCEDRQQQSAQEKEKVVGNLIHDVKNSNIPSRTRAQNRHKRPHDQNRFGTRPAKLIDRRRNHHFEK